MALSYNRYIADGIQNAFPLTFPYIDVGHVVVKVDDSFWNFTIDRQYNRVTLTPTPAVNRVVSVRRHTPRDSPYSNFSGGNAFGQVNVNNNFLWQLYISQEIAEGGLSSDFLPDGDINMGGKRITNLGKPIDVYDAVRYQDLLDFPFAGEKGDKGDKGDQGLVGPQGQQGVQGIEGPQGPYGPTPAHQWNDKFLRFQQGDGTWGNYQDLEGPQGPLGPQGPVGPTPMHEWNNKFLRFQQGDGTWGNYQDLEGPQGPLGPQGPVGPTPIHEWLGKSLRFQQGDGSWGNYQDLEGPQGPLGPQGVVGPTGPQGPTGPRGVQGVQGDIGPRGDKGDKGDDGLSFRVNAIGPWSELSNYDNELKDFSYLATDYAGVNDPDNIYDSFVSVAGTLTYQTRFPRLNFGGVVVLVGGSVQSPATYSITNSVLTFTAQPTVGAKILVRRIMSDVIGALFIKVSDSSGDWSDPIPFGVGPEGPKGIQGDRGPQGPQGVDGPIGPQGPDGLQGPTGIAGPQGPQGLRGPEGPKGVQGDKGLDGVQGPQGDRGPEGPKGVQGDKGIDGPQGPQGIRGPEGPKGVQGDKGIDGQQGPQGVAGPMGPQGPAGVTGATGNQGPVGAQGPVGPMGAQGDRGPNGQAGERGSRAFYVTVSAVSWNQGIVDRFFGPTAEYPYPVPFDLFIQYNESKGYSETRVYRDGAWQTKPVNLVEGFINKITNGVGSTSLAQGSVTGVTKVVLSHNYMNNKSESGSFSMPAGTRTFLVSIDLSYKITQVNEPHYIMGTLKRRTNGDYCGRATFTMPPVGNNNSQFRCTANLHMTEAMVDNEQFYIEWFLYKLNADGGMITFKETPSNLCVIHTYKA